MCRNLKPLYQHLHQVLLQQRVIHADETTVNVLVSEKSKCYMWLYCTGTDSPADSASMPSIALYDYHASRASACAIEFLQGYSVICKSMAIKATHQLKQR
jgi:transposase